jgi:hypothetical protein
MMIEKRRGRDGAYGGLPWHRFGHQTSDEETNNQKYGVALDGHHSMIIYATTTQKQALMMEKGKERRFDRGWGQSSWGIVKNRY